MYNRTPFPAEYDCFTRVCAVCFKLFINCILINTTSSQRNQTWIWVWLIKTSGGVTACHRSVIPLHDRQLHVDTIITFLFIFMDMRKAENLGEQQWQMWQWTFRQTHHTASMQSQCISLQIVRWDHAITCVSRYFLGIATEIVWQVYCYSWATHL